VIQLEKKRDELESEYEKAMYQLRRIRYNLDDTAIDDIDDF
jgi:hypothetical protein